MDSAFSFLGKVSKTKTRNWRKVFKTCRIPIYTFKGFKGFEVYLNT